MALSQLIAVLAVALIFSRIELTSCYVVKGSVSCTDCDPHFDLSGIRVLVKCDQVKKLSMATTDVKGAFETDLPLNAPTSGAPATSNCLAKLIGGRIHLYALKQNMVSKIVMPRGDESETTRTILTPLVVAKSCHGKCGSRDMHVGSSKTIDLPVPPEYGLPPTSYYTPFIPIIGIP